jgi:hypothetical protein
MRTTSASCRCDACGAPELAIRLHRAHSAVLRTLQVMRQYHIQDRDDYKKYNNVVGMITKLTSLVKQLDPKDSTRIELTEQLLTK